MTKRIPAGPAVYVWFSDAAVPVYVGMTKDLTRRTIEHRRSDWGASVAFFTAASVSSLEVAGNVERWLIAQFQPLGNRQHLGASIMLDTRGMKDRDHDSVRALIRRYHEIGTEAAQSASLSVVS